MIEKKRLDQLLHEREPQYSRAQIQSWIMQGKVSIDGKVITKPGTIIAVDTQLTYDFKEPKYVSRAGFKLEKALEHFKIDVTGFVVMDAGLSTGGFTDCLLQKGAQKVYGVDVGYGQVHEKIRNDARVEVIERTNLREVRDLGQLVDLVTLDLSFISVLKVMDAVDAVLKPDGKLLVLIKPQFEARKEDVGKGGIIRDPKIHEEVIKRVTSGIQGHGYQCQGVTQSPIEGTTGNKEFLGYFIRI
jgi:23S rRNA (cytidine1920-2'-O)/16S rRNA (cytidine1409-2'-O)-methyltransferase